MDTERPINTISAELTELEQLDCDDKNWKSLPLCRYAALVSLSKDLDSIRIKTYNDRQYRELDTQLHDLDRRLQDMMYSIERKINSHYERAKEIEKKQERTENPNGSSVELQADSPESVNELRKRLLATKNNTTQLDTVESTDYQNNYQESMQQDLLDSLPAMVTGLKDQAMKFQDLLVSDAQVLKEATENFEKSHGRFGVVSDMLSKYHKEGKLGIFFYIRVILMVVVAFILLLAIIRLIPARH